MENKTIKELAVDLTVEITEVCDDIKGRAVFINQLIRSCSSVGANAHEAKYAQSKADFINKLEIALKECYETEYWLEVLFRVHSIDAVTYKNLLNKSGTIRRKLIASVVTAKGGREEVKTAPKEVFQGDLHKDRYGFIYDLESFFEKHPNLLYPSVALKEYRLRKNGKNYSLREHCKALILSKLSNRQKWYRVEERLDEIQKIFFDYNPEKILACEESFFIRWIKNIKCGTQVTDRDFGNLHQNIRKLMEIEKIYGSIDTFLLSEPANKIVEKISSAESPLKMKTIGPALAWEYLRNVGIDGAKPDVHLKRILSVKRLCLSNNEIISDDEFFDIMTEMKNSTNKLYMELDNYLWSYCAEGQAKICAADPDCDRCVIKKYCMTWGKNNA